MARAKKQLEAGLVGSSGSGGAGYGLQEMLMERMESVVCRQLDVALGWESEDGKAGKRHKETVVELGMSIAEVAIALRVDKAEVQQVLDEYEVRAVKMVPVEDYEEVAVELWDKRGIDPGSVHRRSAMPFYHPRHISGLAKKLAKGGKRCRVVFEVREPADELLLDIRRGYRRWRDPGVLERLVSECHCSATVGAFSHRVGSPLDSVIWGSAVGVSVEALSRVAGVPCVVVQGRREELEGVLNAVCQRMKPVEPFWKTLQYNWRSSVYDGNKVQLAFLSTAGLRHLYGTAGAWNLDPGLLLYRAVFLDNAPLDETGRNVMTAAGLDGTAAGTIVSTVYSKLFLASMSV